MARLRRSLLRFSFVRVEKAKPKGKTFPRENSAFYVEQSRDKEQSSLIFRIV